MMMVRSRIWEEPPFSMIRPYFYENREHITGKNLRIRKTIALHPGGVTSITTNSKHAGSTDMLHTQPKTSSLRTVDFEVCWRH